MCDKLSAPALTTAGESGEISRSNPLSLLPTLLFGLLVIGFPPPPLGLLTLAEGQDNIAGRGRNVLGCPGDGSLNPRTVVGC